jgi:hypothetical protein
MLDSKGEIFWEAEMGPHAKIAKDAKWSFCKNSACRFPLRGFTALYLRDGGTPQIVFLRLFKHRSELVNNLWAIEVDCC